MRVVTDTRCSETGQSLDVMGLEYLLDVNERLDILDYLEAVRNREQNNQQQNPPEKNPFSR